jgi:hypothetical protein
MVRSRHVCARVRRTESMRHRWRPGGVTPWCEQLICSRRRPGVEPAEGREACRDRTGLRFGARQAILPRPVVRAMLSRTTR